MLELFKKNIINIPGKRIKRKLVVFESDDWGSIRIPNQKVFQQLVNEKIIDGTDPFSRFDSLENAQDLTNLFSVLNEYKDVKGNSPIITANMVMANPDFQKIKESNFETYYFETFTKTYSRYSSMDNTFEVMKRGIESKLFLPQFHAREHLNVPVWMDLLRANHKEFRRAFELECFAIPYKSKNNRRVNLMAAYDYYTAKDLNFIKNSIVEGMDIFETMFNFQSKTTVAPCYVWDAEIEKAFQEMGTIVFQGSRFQNSPQPDKATFKKIFHYNGQYNGGLYYLSRNGLFEPSINENINWVDKCLESIEVAFRWNKPAVIGTHRINYIGSLNLKNSTSSLKQMDELLKKILQKWPEVEFITSEELARVYINKGYNG